MLFGIAEDDEEIFHFGDALNSVGKTTLFGLDWWLLKQIYFYIKEK